ncbi:hypothetical protein J3R82DRAFT_3632 [Butyriboletus roseoflavus]|nr:hypothetical protein J3R82DRAFT_3632 [Butyriboletus roseoflavus]
MNRLQTHFRSSSVPPVAGTPGGVVHDGTNHKSTGASRSANSDRLTTLPAVPSHTPSRPVPQTITFASSNSTTPSIDEARNGGKFGLSQIPSGTPGKLQRENIESTPRHKPSPSLQYHCRDKTEGGGTDPASQPTFTQHPLRMHILKSRSISTTSVATPHRSNGVTGREDAMHELLSSERRYARDLALVCNIHIPLAQGKPISVDDIPGPPHLSAKSRPGPSPLRFTASSSSTNSPQSRPLMTSDDVGTVFRNIGDIANLSSHFVKRLETTFDRAFDGSSDEDKVGELFLEIIPNLGPLYQTYSGTHSAALAHCQQLLLSPALWSYTSDIRNHLSDTRIPDLPSFLLKPQKRVSEYCQLLDSIIHNTPVSHRGRASLVQARDQMERVARDIINDRNIARGVLSINTTSISTRINGHGTTESNTLAQLESRLKGYPNFLDKFAEGVTDWAVAMRHSVESLQKWGISFGAVLGLASPSAVHCAAYEVFTSLLSSLPEVCTSLENDLQKTFNPLLRKLKEMTEHPKRRLNEMHSLESARTPSSPLVRLRGSDTSKNHQYYHQLRSTLLSQLPVLLQAMDRATALAVLIVAQRQVAFFNAVRDKWINFFNSMTEEGEHYGGAEETLRTWRARWEEGLQTLLRWGMKYRLGESAVRQNSSASWSEISLPIQLSVASAGLPLVNDTSRFPLGVPRRLRTSISYPPGPPPSSRRTRQSITDVAPVPYTIQVRRSYTPPPHNPYWGHPFFKLVIGDSFEVVHEYGHPSTHTDLPQFFLGKEREDCLLKVRARNGGVEHEAGDVGWALARFVSPD